MGSSGIAWSGAPSVTQAPILVISGKFESSVKFVLLVGRMTLALPDAQVKPLGEGARNPAWVEWMESPCSQATREAAHEQLRCTLDAHGRRPGVRDLPARCAPGQV